MPAVDAFRVYFRVNSSHPWTQFYQGPFVTNLTSPEFAPGENVFFQAEAHNPLGWSPPSVEVRATVACAPATFFDAQSLACTPCKKDTYNPFWTVNPSCSPCPPGKFSAGNSTDCNSCSPGSNFNGSACVPCPAGHIEVASICQPCAAGQHNPRTGQTSCKACSAGNYSTEGSVACQPCPPGSFSPVDLSGNCTLCSAGSVNPAWGQHKCSPCPNGTVAPVAGLLQCSGCPVGEKAVAGAVCANCGKGTFNPFPNASTCTPCPAGQATLLENATACSNCTPGTNSSSTGAAQCGPCSPGHVASGEGGVECTPCPAGSFSSGFGGSQCSSCPADHYQAASAGSSCLKCPWGSWTKHQMNSTSCVGCVSGEIILNSTGSCFPCLPQTYSVGVPTRSQAECRPCPAGAWCLGGDLVVPKPGFYSVVPPTVGQDFTFAACDLASSCPGYSGPIEISTGSNVSYLAAVNSSFACAQGYSGRLCLSCAPGYGRTGQYQCSVCNVHHSVGQMLFLALTVLVGTGALLFLLWRARKVSKQWAQNGWESQNGSMSMMKIMMSHLQMINIVLYFNVDWPPFLRTLFFSQNSASNLGEIVSFDCVLQGVMSNVAHAPTFYLELLFYFFLGIALILSSVLLWALIYQWKKRHRVRPTLKGIFMDKCLLTVLVLLFISHPTISRRVFYLFTCKQLGAKRYLLEALDQECWTGMHMEWVLAFGLPTLAAYVFGVPLASLALMWHHRADITAPTRGLPIKQRTIYKFSFLITGFKAEFFYWEALIMFRKVSVIGATVFFSSMDSQTQALACIAIIVVAATIHEKAQPYKNPQIGELERYALLTSFITVYCGLFLSNGAHKRGAAVASFFTYIILLVNLAYVAFWALRFSKWVTFEMRRRIVENKKKLMNPLQFAELQLSARVSRKTELTEAYGEGAYITEHDLDLEMHLLRSKLQDMEELAVTAGQEDSRSNMMSYLAEQKGEEAEKLNFLERLAVAVLTSKEERQMASAWSPAIRSYHQQYDLHERHLSTGDAIRESVFSRMRQALSLAEKESEFLDKQKAAGRAAYDMQPVPVMGPPAAPPTAHTSSPNASPAKLGTQARRPLKHTHSFSRPKKKAAPKNNKKGALALANTHVAQARAASSAVEHAEELS